jgi:phosphatidylinositol alpha 1,6-mannosyltransferase
MERSGILTGFGQELCERSNAGAAESAGPAGYAPPRIAYFPDSYHEINGVAHTSRHFEAFARRRNLPFLCVRAGEREPSLKQDGNVWTLELPRSAFSFALEKDLRFDPAFPRHVPLIDDVLARFQPDLIHVTGPSEVGITGAGLAGALGLPLAASWHTNVHEYAARRSDWLLRFLPPPAAEAAAHAIEGIFLSAIAGFYSQAQVIFAPNRSLCTQLEQATGRHCFLMPRGVDAELFHPRKRSRRGDDREHVLGFVGRLSVEKNVTLLACIQRELEAAGVENVRFFIVGDGAEGAWLRARMPRAEFAGVLRGEALAVAYANMDLFIFPSHTDTFGNVVLEAMASEVPAVVTPDGGPKSIVRNGETGRIVADEGFADAIAEILADREKHRDMRRAARAYAETASWDAVFEGVYAAYGTLLPAKCVARA